jgi:hypothetical protein
MIMKEYANEGVFAIRFFLIHNVSPSGLQIGKKSTARPDGLRQTGYPGTISQNLEIIIRRKQAHRRKAFIQTLIGHHALFSPTIHTQRPSIFVSGQNTKRLTNVNGQFIR